jgi:hypothetical protein
MQELRWLIPIGGAFVLGVVIGIGFDEHAMMAPREVQITAAEIHQNYIERVVTPGDIVLRFEVPEQIRAAVESSGPNVEVVAYEEHQGERCVVVLPTTIRIMGHPRTGHAMMDDDDTETIAHELLHCFAGHWHDSWKNIFARQISEQEDYRPAVGSK